MIAATGTMAATGSGAPVSPDMVAAASERLAAPSAVVSAALRLLDDPGVPLRRVADRVGESPELAAQTLRMASAALNGRPAVTLEEAVVRIGARGLRGLLLAAETYPLMAGSLPVYGLPRMALVARATDIARAAQDIARHTDPDSAPLAHIGGLLADIGKPVLADVATVVGLEPPEPVTAVAQERALFGVDHAVVGAEVTTRWGLGERLASAVASHHDIRPPDDAAARAVWLGALLMSARGGNPAAAERLAPALESCGLDEAVASAIVVGTDAEPVLTRPPMLTDREVEVLRMVAEGGAAKQVAFALGCSPSTVHNHLHHIYRKLNVTGQAQALLLARDRGWV